MSDNVDDSDSDAVQTEFNPVVLTETDYEYGEFDDKSRNISKNVKILMGLDRWTELYNYLITLQKLPANNTFKSDDLRTLFCIILKLHKNYVFLFRSVSKTFLYDLLTDMLRDYNKGVDIKDIETDVRNAIIIEFKNKFKNIRFR